MQTKFTVLRNSVFSLILFGFISVLTNAAYAQVKTPSQRLDSLLFAVKNHPVEDSAKVVTLRNTMMQYFRMKEQSTGLAFADKALKLAAKLNIAELEAGIYYRVGLNFHGKNDVIKAEEYYHKSIERYAYIKDFGWVAGVYQNLGVLYGNIPDYTKALEAYQTAINFLNKIDSAEIEADIYANMGVMYTALGRQATAMNYLDRSLKTFLKEGENARGVAVVSASIGDAYLSANEAELKKMNVAVAEKNNRALANYNRALKVAQAIHDQPLIASFQENIGRVLEKMGNLPEALNSYQRSVELLEEMSQDESTELIYANTLLSLAKFYYQTKAYNQAIPLLEKAIKIGENRNLMAIIRDAYLELSLNNEKLGKYNLSLANYRNHIAFKEKIFDQEKEKEITRRQLQLDFSVRENDYQLKQKLTDGELQRQFLVGKQQQQKLTLRQQELALSDKEKTLQRLTFLKKQADLENEKLYQVNLLNQEQAKSSLDKEIKDREIGVQKTELRVNKNINIFLAILTLILASSALLVYRAQRKTAKLNKLVSEQKVELEKLGMVKDRIFSVVSHDMRAPVNSLISFIQLLEGGHISQEKLNRYASNLKDTLGYTSAMMENLLNWASSQMQGFKPYLEDFGLQHCAQDVINSMEAIAHQKNIKIENNISLDQRLYADKNMTALVLRNLMSNAIKFTPTGGVIKVWISDGLKDKISIHVTDTGVGLAAQQLTNFNKPGFHETGRSTVGTNKEKGTGIGLVLCKTFTLMMNGSLKAESEVGKGSTFTLSLPKAA